MLFMCRPMTIMVDTFCCRLRMDISLDKAAYHWNVTQAMLRRASDVVELCLFILQMTAFVALLVVVSDMLRCFDPRHNPSMYQLSSTLLVLVAIAYMFFCAASITDRCRQVPPLVN